MKDWKTISELLYLAYGFISNCWQRKSAKLLIDVSLSLKKLKAIKKYINAFHFIKPTIFIALKLNVKFF
jgi:hypothetical protein